MEAEKGGRKMPEKQKEKESIDIYHLLLEASERQRRQKRAELLKSVDVKDLFESGGIKIDMKTCKGVECKLCIKACPTNALYWKAGEIGVTEELCIYCTSCVLNCMVDDCIVVERKRPNGENERFGRPSEILTLWEHLNTRKRIEATRMILPDEEAFLKRYRKPYFEF